VSLKFIGAGLGRTGTTSLKLALEKLLMGNCYHMISISSHPEHIELWHRAANGDMPDWKTLFTTYSAVTDWPASAFYKELMDFYPEAKVVLSYRDPEQWFESCQNTIFPKITSTEGKWGDMIRAIVFKTFCEEINDKDKCIAAYKRHLEEVKAYVPANRLVEWQAGDGWKPLCEAVGFAEPDIDFPHLNTTRDFQQGTKSN